ncbi:hypothetical protein PR048_012296 [Dryococelus australis]|uniref:Uncharacterized protein n=1 Tax=Dryococelus australis TaxID=614101 RepID=A0ABQ9HPB8_9NEOP|nr:hypothetical protein PR048_012296 [Dryococelus australis]
MKLMLQRLKCLDGPKVIVGDKLLLPTLVKQLLKLMQILIFVSYASPPPNTTSFRKCRIHPVNKQEFLARFQNLKEVDINTIGDAFLKHLLEQHKDIEGVKTGKQRKKKLRVPAGNEPEREKPKRKPGHPKPPVVLTESEESGEFEEMELGSGNESETFIQQKKELKENDFTTSVRYSGEEYPGIFQKLPTNVEKAPTVSCMEKSVKSWKWPKKEDALQYKWEDVIKKIAPPKLLNKRGFFIVPELDYFV